MKLEAKKFQFKRAIELSTKKRFRNSKVLFSKASTRKLFLQAQTDFFSDCQRADSNSEQLLTMWFPGMK